MFYKDLNVTIESCVQNSTNSEDDVDVSDEDEKLGLASFILKLNSFENTILQMKDQHWVPFYIDNSNWKNIEFICHIKVDFMVLSNDQFYFKDFKFVSFDSAHLNWFCFKVFLICLYEKKGSAGRSQPKTMQRLHVGFGL
jgi:hypothetical protein